MRATTEAVRAAVEGLRSKGVRVEIGPKGTLQGSRLLRSVVGGERRRIWAEVVLLGLEENSRSVSPEHVTMAREILGKGGPKAPHRPSTRSGSTGEPQALPALFAAIEGLSQSVEGLRRDFLGLITELQNGRASRTRTRYIDPATEVAGPHLEAAVPPTDEGQHWQKPPDRDSPSSGEIDLSALPRPVKVFGGER